MKFNPSSSLILAMIYSLYVSFMPLHLLMMLPLIVLITIQRALLFKILKRLLILNVFVIILVLFFLVEASFEAAVTLLLRINAILFLNLMLFYESKGYDIVRGLHQLRFPNAFVSLTFFTLHMIHYLKEEMHSIKLSLKSRGFIAKNQLFSYQTMGNMVGLLIVKAIRKSQTLQQMLVARNFQGELFFLNEFILKKEEIILTISLVMMITIKGVL